MQCSSEPLLTSSGVVHCFPHPGLGVARTLLNNIRSSKQEERRKTFEESKALGLPSAERSGQGLLTIVNLLAALRISELEANSSVLELSGRQRLGVSHKALHHRCSYTLLQGSSLLTGLLRLCAVYHLN